MIAPPGFQEMVELFMREGMLFGQAVLRARAEYFTPAAKAERLRKRDAAAAEQLLLQDEQRRAETVKRIEARRAFWAGAR
jgi:hypothetical protein